MWWKLELSVNLWLACFCSFWPEIILNRKFLELPIPLLQHTYLLKEIVLTLIYVVLDSTFHDGMINGAGIQKAMTWQRSSVLKLHICHLFGMNWRSKWTRDFINCHIVRVPWRCVESKCIWLKLCDFLLVPLWHFPWDDNIKNRILLLRIETRVSYLVYFVVFLYNHQVLYYHINECKWIEVQSTIGMSTNLVGLQYYASISYYHKTVKYFHLLYFLMPVKEVK